jgi:hypothetical protein
VLLLAWAGWLVVRQFQPRTARLPTTTYEFQPACQEGRGTAYPQAHPYAGAGEHPIAVFAVYGEDESKNVFDVFDEAQATNLPWEAGAVTETQLVACAKRTSVAADVLTTCQYRADGQAGTASKVPMRKARYEVTLRELRTHRVIVTVRLTGEGTACPPSVRVDVTEISAWPSEEQWKQAIGRYVTGDA